MEEVKEEVVNQEEAKVDETPKKPKLDIDAMPNKEAKKMLKELLLKQETLEKELEQAKKEAQSNKDSWYRTAADFDNFRKRNADTRINAYKDGKSDVICKILVVGDNLDRALKLDLDEKTKAGIEMTARQFTETLASLDCVEINPEGEGFNPDTQEAIMKMPPEEGEEEGKVKQVFKKGYKLGDKIIRYAQVVVTGK